MDHRVNALLEIRDAAGTVVAACEDYTAFTGSIRYNDVGAWTVTLPLTSASAGLLLTPGYGIQFTVNDVLVLSGMALTADGDTGDGVGQVTISGADDMLVLADRLASAQPATATQPYSVSAYDARTGVAETIIKQYVNLNAGPGAVAARQWPGLTIAADDAQGTSVKGNARWGRLLDVAAELARAGGLGLSCVGLVFDVTVPEDLSATVEFSEQRGSLGRVAFSQQAPGSTYVYVGGSGEGAARTFYEQAATESLAAGWPRRERFRDARDTTDAVVLAQRAVEELGADVDATKLGLTIEAIDAPGCRWPADYQVGDLVTVVTPWGVTLTRRVTGLQVALSAETGTTITPTLGVLAPETPTALAALSAQARRLARLETR